MPNGTKNGPRNGFSIEQVFLRKVCFYYRKSKVLEVTGVEKSMEIHSKMMRKQVSKIRCNKYRKYVKMDPKWTSKSMKNIPKMPKGNPKGGQMAEKTGKKACEN